MDANYAQLYKLSKDCLGQSVNLRQHLQLTAIMDRTNIVRLWLCIGISLVTAKELKISRKFHFN